MSGPRFGPLPEWLDDSLDAVLRDLQRPAEVPVRLGYSESDSTLWVQELGHESLLGVRVEGRGAVLTVLLADELQEQFFPETEAAWGEPRPLCPGHPHPAVATMVDREPWWCCPHDDRRIARIGELNNQN